MSVMFQAGEPTKEAIAEVRKNLGLDEPLYVQYGIFLKGLVTFDFGESFRSGMPVIDLIKALWDLYAKQKGVSLSKALGGEKEEIEVGVSIGIEPTVEGLLKKVENFLAEGYKKIKVKIKPGIDVERIKAIRETFGYQGITLWNVQKK